MRSWHVGLKLLSFLNIVCGSSTSVFEIVLMMRTELVGFVGTAIL